VDRRGVTEGVCSGDLAVEKKGNFEKRTLWAWTKGKRGGGHPAAKSRFISSGGPGLLQKCAWRVDELKLKDAAREGAKDKEKTPSGWNVKRCFMITMDRINVLRHLVGGGDGQGSWSGN